MWFFANSACAQLTVASGMTPEQYVQSLVGGGIEISNVTFTGTPTQIGTFNGTNANVGFDAGVVMAAGPINGLLGAPGTADTGQPGSGIADNDLLAVAQSVNPGIFTTNDAAILEFDFVPSSNIAAFNFVFSSDEYLQWVNSNFNDVFAFFVSGPGIAGPFSAPPAFPGGAQNVAVVPGTNTPITISTIHPGLNGQFYINNNGNSFSHNGFTVPIPVELAVQCGETYHFKYAIADCTDDFLNTAVFIEAGSFISDAVDVTVATVSGDTTIVEGCTDANFYFTRPDTDTADTLIINYEIGGEAIEGTDYNFLPDSIVFLPGQDSVTVTLTPFQDGIDEDFESVTISVELINICGDTIVSSGIIYIGDGPILNITESDTTIVCANDSVSIFASATGGYAPYTYEWTDLDGNSLGTGDTIAQGIEENGSIDVIVIATDFCLFSGSDTVTITLNQTLGIDTIYVGPATCEPDGFASAIVVGDSVTPEHGVYYSWLNSADQDGPTASVWTDLPSGWYYISVEDAVCTIEDSAYVELLDPPIASLTASPVEGCAPLLVTFDYGESQNAEEYELFFGDGTSQSSSTIQQMEFTYESSSSATYTAELIVSQGTNCADSMEVTIQIGICGCTVVGALNYDPTATIDDGSCVYPVPPEPIVDAPNVFTPNSDIDNSNEVFELTTENLSELQLIIFNRWGNIVFDETSIDLENENPAWNGSISNTGSDAEEGVYFYKYIAFGFEDQFNDVPPVRKEGHGFLTLVRNQ